jgi:hypothetical protein
MSFFFHDKCLGVLICDYTSAENGCFIKTRAVGSYNGEWINMVSNFNLTWKSACLEILNYVRPLYIFSEIPLFVKSLIYILYSSLRGLQDRSSKRDKLLWYGDSGWQVCLGILRIGNGHRGKQLKRRIIFLIGMCMFLFSLSLIGFGPCFFSSSLFL